MLVRDNWKSHLLRVFWLRIVIVSLINDPENSCGPKVGKYGSHYQKKIYQNKRKDPQSTELKTEVTITLAKHIFFAMETGSRYKINSIGNYQSQKDRLQSRKTSCLPERMCLFYTSSPQSFLCFLWTFFFFFFVSPRKLCCTVNCVRREGVAQFEGGEVHSRPHSLVQNTVAKLFNGTDAASVCCFLGHTRLCCFIKNEKVGILFPLAGQRLEQQEEPFLCVIKMNWSTMVCFWVE